MTQFVQSALRTVAVAVALTLLSSCLGYMHRHEDNRAAGPDAPREPEPQEMRAGRR